MLRIITEICIICNEVAKFKTQKICIISEIRS